MEDRLMDANTEDYLEILYWEFDSEKKKFSFSERDLFKAKMRGLIRTIQNTSAIDKLLEEMARALEDIVKSLSCGLQDTRASVLAQNALQKWEATCVGDGCRYCNPQYYIDMLEEQVKERSADSDTSEFMLIAHMDAYAEAKKKYEPLLEKMAEALERASKVGHFCTRDQQWIDGLVQEYQEMKDAK